MIMKITLDSTLQLRCQILTIFLRFSLKWLSLTSQSHLWD